MKLSVSNDWLNMKYGSMESLRLLKEAGFDRVDFALGSRENDILGNDYREKAAEIREYMDKIGIECKQAHAPFELKYENSLDMSDEIYERTVRSIESAAILGAEYIVVHRVRVPDGIGVDSMDYNYGFYKGLEKYCEKFDIGIGVENLFSYSNKFKTFIDDNCLRQALAKPQYLKEMLERLDSPYFAACIDTGHAAVSGNDPEDFIRAFDNKSLRLLHIQDTDYLGDRHWVPYTGKHNWDNVAKALKDIDYKGDFSLEVYAGKPHEGVMLTETLKLIEKIGRHIIGKIEAAKNSN